jgi:K+/H+ antiporter YhaU regulatory subunit KhtT
MIMAMGVTDTFLLLPEHSACGKTLVELALRTHTGATIIAVVRGETHVTNPPLEYRLKAGDLLILVGTHAQMDKAFQFLDGKQEGQGA